MSEMNRKTECAAVLRGHGTTSGRSAANVQFDTEKPRTKCPLVAHCLPSCTDHRPTRIEIEKKLTIVSESGARTNLLCDALFPRLLSSRFLLGLANLLAHLFFKLLEDICHLVRAGFRC